MRQNNPPVPPIVGKPRLHLECTDRYQLIADAHSSETRKREHLGGAGCKIDYSGRSVCIILSTDALSSELHLQGELNDKWLYCEAVRSSSKQWFQGNWGRIQELGEEYYIQFFRGLPPERIEPQKSTSKKTDDSLAELFAEITKLLAEIDNSGREQLAKALKNNSDVQQKINAIKAVFGSKERQKETILERFEGFVEQIQNDTAYVSLKSEYGDILYGQYPASKLTQMGIFERRRFTCITKNVGGKVHVCLTPIPDIELSDQREREIQQEIERALGSDDDDDF